MKAKFSDDSEKSSQNSKLVISVLTISFVWFSVFYNHPNASVQSFSEQNSQIMQISKNIIFHNNGCKNKHPNPKFVLGILSSDNNTALRNAQRRTWLSECKFYYLFLLDRETTALNHENEQYDDMIYINSQFSGPETGFGEKLIKWLDYAFVKFPSAELIVKLDDDFFADSNKLYERLEEVSDPLLYTRVFLQCFE